MESTDQRERLHQYLMEQMERRRRMDDPEYRKNANDAQMRSYDSDARNNLAASLMASAAQMGTLGGKQASAKPVADFASGQAKANANFQAGLEAEDKARENRYGMNAKVYQYLADMQQKKKDEAATADFRAKSLAAQGAKAAEDRALKERELGLKERGLAQDAALAREKMAAESKKDATKAQLPKDAEKEMEAISTKNAGIRTSVNLMKSQLAEFQNAKTVDDKIRIGRSMLKSLNSLISADAVGAEEVKRLGDALEYQIANLTGPGKMFGRDLEGFNSQAQALINSADNTAKLNENRIDELYGRPKRHNVAGPDMTPRGAKPEDGEAIAAPAKAPPAPPPGKVRVTNGQEELYIDKSDLEEAAKDGFKPVRGASGGF